MGIIKQKLKKLSGPKITGKKIDLDKLAPKKKPVATSEGETKEQKEKRKRITNKVNPKKFVKSKGNSKKKKLLKYLLKSTKKNQRNIGKNFKELKKRNL